MPSLVGFRKVRFNTTEVNLFRAGWPCCKLRERAYWFEFDADHNLIDTDVPEHDDGPEATALAAQAEEFLKS